ncbi:unnamed protein product [Moneuplotes crassus]|uniref:Uncharacterized protein n=1 Tax=Euplotes crassus TaxID=5936 RepID=A0AAD1YA65_EUPCR|nr:unnamed protein product [Moneuplotes crassus]
MILHSLISRQNCTDLYLKFRLSTDQKSVRTSTRYSKTGSTNYAKESVIATCSVKSETTSLSKFMTSWLNSRTRGQYHYHKNFSLLPKVLKKIGSPTESLYDTCVNYFFSPSFKAAEGVSSPKEDSIAKKKDIEQSRPSSRLASGKTTRVKGCTHKSREPKPKDSVQQRLYSTKTYRVYSKNFRNPQKSSLKKSSKAKKKATKSRNNTKVKKYPSTRVDRSIFHSKSREILEKNSSLSTILFSENDQITNHNPAKQDISRYFSKPMLVPQISQVSLSSIGYPDSYDKENVNSSNIGKYAKIKSNISQRKQSYNSLLEKKSRNPCKATMSQTNTPHSNDTAKNSEHFSKILNKFQNVFKKEETEARESKIKSSHSKRSFLKDNNYIWKRYESSKNVTRNNFNQAPNYLSQGCMPVKCVYEDYQSNKPVKAQIKPEKLDNFMEKYVPSTDIHPEKVKFLQNYDRNDLREKESLRPRGDQNCPDDSKESYNTSSNNTVYLDLYSKDLDHQRPQKAYKDNIPAVIPDSQSLKWDKFKRIEEEINRFQEQIDKMEKIRAFGRKRLEYHKMKHDESLSISTIRMDTPPSRDTNKPRCL